MKRSSRPRNLSFPSAQQHRWTRIPRISAGIVPDLTVMNRFPPQGQAISCACKAAFVPVERSLLLVSELRHVTLLTQVSWVDYHPKQPQNQFRQVGEDFISGFSKINFQETAGHNQEEIPRREVMRKKVVQEILMKYWRMKSGLRQKRRGLRNQQQNKEGIFRTLFSGPLLGCSVNFAELMAIKITLYVLVAAGSMQSCVTVPTSPVSSRTESEAENLLINEMIITARSSAVGDTLRILFVRMAPPSLWPIT
ncbi:hypothetical protein V6N13_101201 [Hibiscus sabdariffa]